MKRLLFLCLFLSACATLEKQPVDTTPYDPWISDLNYRLCMEKRGEWVNINGEWRCR